VKSMVSISVCLWFWFFLLPIFVVLFGWFLGFVFSQKVQATGSVVHYYLCTQSCCCVWPFSSFDRNYFFLFLFLFFPSRGAHTHGERVKKNTRGQNFLLFLFLSSPSPQYKVTPSVSFSLSLCSSFLADTHMCFSLSLSLPTTSSTQMSTEKKKDRNTHAPIHIYACKSKTNPAMASSLSTTKSSSLSPLTCQYYIFSLRLARPLALSAGIDDGGIKTCT